MAHLKILKGREVGRILDLGEESFLGRDDNNTYKLLDEACSRHHAKVVRLDDAFVLVDLGSNNGTFLNGQKVKEGFLHHGDRVQVGKTVLAFEAEETRLQMVTAQVRDFETHRITVEKTLPTDAPRGEAVESRLKHLYEIAALLNSSLDTRPLMNGLAGMLREVLDADVVAVLADGAEPAVQSHPKSGEVSISRSAIDQARAEKRAILFACEPDKGSRSIIAENIRSILVAPIARGDRVSGVLYSDSRRELRKFTQDDLAFLNAAAQPAALALEHAMAYGQSQARLRELGGATPLIGNDPNWRAVIRLIDKAAPIDSTVLILGESGTGKELVARALHEQSARYSGPFVAINCAALVETLLESELFGHEKGAFTGASRSRIGKFESAEGGTIFLDEIGEISQSLQAKLLRVLQEKTFFRVGGTRPVKVDVRIIAATNRDLEKAIKESVFREDLYYRLGVIKIQIPPLRDRKGDIPPLAEYFLERVRYRLRKRNLSLSKEAMDALVLYRWPGNVRELENVIERASILTDGVEITPSLLPPDVRAPRVISDDGWPISIEEAEKLCVRRAIEKTGGKKGEAAKLLGVSWPTLNKKLKDYGLEID